MRKLDPVFLTIGVLVSLTAVLIGSRYRDDLAQKRFLEAIEKDDDRLVASLLDQGVDPRRNRKWPASPIGMACASRARKTLRTLLKRGEKPGPDDVSDTATGGDMETLEMLLAAGANPNTRVHGMMPLMVRLSDEHKNLVMERLLKAGADPNIPNNVSWYKPLGFTPLMASVSSLNPEGVRLLIKHGANLDAQIADRSSVFNGYTALMLAERSGYANSVRQLINAGADTTLVGGDGATAISLVNRSQNEEIAAIVAKRPIRRTLNAIQPQKHRDIP